MSELVTRRIPDSCTLNGRSFRPDDYYLDLVLRNQEMGPSYGQPHECFIPKAKEVKNKMFLEIELEVEARRMEAIEKERKRRNKESKAQAAFNDVVGGLLENFNAIDWNV